MEILTKIEKIKNIGSIENVEKIPPNYDFKKVNIFYGLNGSGKTTFSSILKSLRNNDLDILKGRKSLLNNNDSEVEFKFNEDRIGFKDKWFLNNDGLLNRQRPKILIFDDEFIKKNIFAEEFDIGHKKSIYRIMFGEKGGVLSNEWKTLIKEKKEIETKKDELLKTINPFYFSELEYTKIDITKFNKNKLLEQKKDIEKKINEIQNFNSIKLKQSLTQASIPDFDFVKSDDFWEYDIDSEAHATAKKQVDEFKEKYFKNTEEAELFIKTGFLNIQEEKNCPFCHSRVDDKMLDLYKEYFNDIYDKWVTKIVSYKNNLENWNISAIEEKIKAEIDKNNIQFEYWKEKIPSLLLHKVNLYNIFNNLKIIKQEGWHLVTSKINNPSKIIDKHDIHRINASKDKQLELIENYNKWVEEQNKFIEKYKEDLEKIDLSEFEQEKNKITDKISRFSDDEIEKCNNYKKAELTSNEIIKKVNEKVIELNEYTKSIITKYKKLINEKIKDFGCNHFEISEFINKTGENAIDPYVEIVLRVLDKEISMSKNKSNEPCFKNTLSKGEKNTLAFAFFLSFFEEEVDNKEDYILIFDDPLTSFDDNRDDDTASAIKKISSNVNQVFILTHKYLFMQRLYCKFGKSPIYVRVEKNDNKTNFRVINIDELFLKPYQKIINRFIGILKNGINNQLREDDLCKDIRHIFEYVLWSKYYDLIKENNDVISGNKQLINKQALEDIFFSKGLLTNIKDEFLDLCNIGHEHSHNNENQLNPEQVKTKITKTLDIIKKI